MSKALQAGVLAIGLSVASPALAGSHTWRVNEVFSNADGTIQFIELKECCGMTAEIFLGGKDVITDVGGGSFTFPANIVGPTNDHHLLLATAGFAALPGAPTPDFTIADNFVAISGDTVRYGPNPPGSNYHVFTFVSGDLPTDCVSSIQLTSWTPNTFVTAPNTPTNYHGATGTVDCSVAACPWDCDGNADGIVSVTDLLALLGQYDPGSPAVCTGGACDYNGDGCVDVIDLLKMLAHYDPAGLGCPQ